MDNIEWWNSEETVVPYICKTDNSPHRYFVDFTIKFKGGATLLVEVKPKSSCKPPKVSKSRPKEKLMEEVLVWAKNTSKWEAANAFAQKNGMVFQVWNEDTLKKIGIHVMNNKWKNR